MQRSQFLICNSCFWCASLLFGYLGPKIKRCPCCRSDDLEKIPLALDEKYKFSYSSKNGVTLEFV